MPKSAHELNFFPSLFFSPQLKWTEPAALLELLRKFDDFSLSRSAPLEHFFTGTGEPNNIIYLQLWERILGVLFLCDLLLTLRRVWDIFFKEILYLVSPYHWTYSGVCILYYQIMDQNLWSRQTLIIFMFTNYFYILLRNI